MLKSLTRAITYLGRRGASLLFFALVFVVTGWSYLNLPASFNGRGTNFELMLELLPLHAWGIIWIAAGIICVFGSVIKLFDYLAFFLGSAVLTIWGFGLAVLGLMNRGTHPYLGAVIYVAFAVFMIVISGWPEETTPEDE